MDQDNGDSTIDIGFRQSIQNIDLFVQLDDSINNETQLPMMSENEAVDIVDHLAKWYHNEMNGIRITFQGKYRTQLKMGLFVNFPYDFSVMLVNTINHMGKKMNKELKIKNDQEYFTFQAKEKKQNVWKALDRSEFVPPLYGGSKEHIFNHVKVFNDHASLGVHLHGDQEFELFVIILRQLDIYGQDNFGDDDCQCDVENEWWYPRCEYQILRSQDFLWSKKGS